MINWNNKLCHKALMQFKNKSEEETVHYIYNQKQSLSGTKTKLRSFSEYLESSLAQEKYKSNMCYVGSTKLCDNSQSDLAIL